MFKRTSIALKLTLLLISVGVCSLVFVCVLTYSSMAYRSERFLGERLENIARTASLLISVEDHNAVFQAYLDRDPKLTEKQAFLRIQSVLRKIKKINDLTTDVYTLVRPYWYPDKMIFMTMSNENPFVGNALPLSDVAKKVFQTGRPHRSGIYMDKEGHWISGIAPIKNASGKVIAVIEVDYKADEEVAKIKKELLWIILKTCVPLMLLLVVVGVYLGKRFTKPILQLSFAAQRLRRGDFDVEVASSSNDEVGFLGVTMAELAEQLKENKKAIEGYIDHLEDMVEQRLKEITGDKK